MWNQRHHEMIFIRKELHPYTGLKILEIGAWNNWLTNKLIFDRQQVVAVDYFDDEFDGLGARKHYNHPNWSSIQMDPEYPELIDNSFDVIIFNHNLPYFTRSTIDSAEVQGKAQSRRHFLCYWHSHC